jgi:UDP-GlcNAc:undecaprenyl-phosphate/decaprenyl-phosphate GlcNAc-1-phosphate transferase
MAFFIPLIVTALAVPLIIRISAPLGLVDRPDPDPLKIHRTPTPRSGGLALATGLAAAAFIKEPSIALALGGAAALGLGVIDDRRGLSPAVRLLTEVVIAGTTASVILREAGWLWVALGAVVIVVAISAANLFDGLDGLLSGAGLLTACGLALLATGPAQSWLLAIGGCLAGFLIHNRPPARIFLGDGGAYLVGVTLGMGLAGLAPDPNRFLGGMLAFGLIGADLLLTIVRRWRQRRPLLVGDRSHLYDQLTDRGWSPWRTLTVIWAIHAALVAAGLGVSLLSLPMASTAVGVAVVAGAVLLWRLGFVSAGQVS